MLLGRLRVRQKLVLLVVPLLLLAVAGAVPLVLGRVQAAERSGDSARLVQRAVRITELVQELQQERLASLGYLSGDVLRDRMVARSSRVLELARQISTDYGAGDDKLALQLRQVTLRSGLDGLRPQVLERRTPGIAVYTGFTAVIGELIDVLKLTDGADLRTNAGRQQLALDSIIRHDEATAAEGAALFIEPGRRITMRVVGLVGAGQALESRAENVFKTLADPSAADLYERVEDGPSSVRLNNYLEGLINSNATQISATIAANLQPQVETLTAASRGVETLVAGQAVNEANRSARTDRWLAGIAGGIALLLLVGAGLLSVLITRSIARPLRRLTASADEVADVAQQELVRVADTDDPEAAVPHLRPVRVGTTDEMGELAKAFNRVQQVASNLVERQLVSRQNVATMFGNVGRRTQNLVGRQLAMIDSLERNEQDPALLDRLYRLDHVSTRLRRNANSLVVLSGATDQQITGEPLSVADTIRSALGEIEGFQRVRLGAVDRTLLTPHVTPDVILLLAELLENGTSFSPPHTEVEVAAQTVDGGDVEIRIVDHGLGMTAEQLEAENSRLVSRERLDLAPTDVLGLFVVGRLARRHGIDVRLMPTPGTGVTAEVRIPVEHVVRSERSAPAPARPVEVREPAPAGSPAGDERGWWDSPARLADRAAAPTRHADDPASAGAPADAGIGTGLGPWAPGTGRSGAAGSGAAGSGTAGSGTAGSGTAGSGTAANGSTPDDAVANRAARTGGDAPANGHGRNGTAADGAGRAGDGTAARGAPDGTAANGSAPDGTAASGHATGGAAAEGAARADDATAANGVAPAGEGAAANGLGRGGPADADGPGGALPWPFRVNGRPRVERQDGAGTDGHAGSGAAPEVPRPRGAAGMVRRVRGAQHPDTDARPVQPATAPPPSPDDARQEIEDFEAGVQRALRETGADGGDGFVVEDDGVAPWTDLDTDDPAGAEQTRALVREFEDGVRRALARLDEVAARPAEPAPLFERPATPVPPAARRPAEPPRPERPPRRLDAGAGASRAVDDRPGALGDPRPLERRRRPDTPTPPAAARPQPAPAADPRTPPAGAGRPTPEPEPAPAGEPRPVVPPTPPAADSGLVASPTSPAAEPREVREPSAPAGPDPRPAPLGDPAAETAAEDTAAAGTGPSVQPVPAEVPAVEDDRADGPDHAVGDPGEGSAVARPRANETSPNGGVPNAPDTGTMDPAGRGLVRRVPGAQMPAGARAAVPGIPAPARPDGAEQNGAEQNGAEQNGAEQNGAGQDAAGQDAAEQDAAAARSLVEEFEAGVQRALQDAPGTAGTDEDGAR